MKEKGAYVVLWILAGVGLVLTILPPIMVFAGWINKTLQITLMTLGMIVWFGARMAIRSEEKTEG